MGGWGWNFYDFTDAYLFYPLIWDDGSDEPQRTLIKVKYHEVYIEAEVDPDAADCSPTHESGDVLYIT